jgi:hypothetical protein
MTEKKKTIRDSVKDETQTFITEIKKFGREAGDLALRGSEEISRISSIGKLKGKIIILKREREQKVKELGESCLKCKEKHKGPELLKIIEEIKEIGEKRKACEEKVESLSKR